MKTTRKKHQGIRIFIKKQLAVLKPLKCRYCPWRLFSNTQRYLSHVHNHATHVKYYWYKKSWLHRPLVASIAVVPPRIICRPVHEKLHKQEFQCMENTHKCRFCSRCFTTVYQKTRHEEGEHLCDSCEKTFENAQVKKLHRHETHDTKCRFCSRYVPTVRGKIFHEKYEHLCDSCGKPFENAQVKELHKLETHGMKANMNNIKCHFCSRYFTTARGKNIHEKYEHICEFRSCEDTFQNVTDKILHKQEIHGADENRCCFCSRFFGSAYQKSLHEKCAHARNFIEKTLDKAEVRKTHELECDSVGKKHKCRFCSKYFATADKKTLHEKYEHLCKFCEKTFDKVEVRRTHELKCRSSEKYMHMHKCRFCRTFFATANKKILHENSEHLRKFCEKTFNKAEDRKTHELECDSMEKNKFL